MPSSHGHAAYDENLLAAAPAATKAQLQSGYTTDLLDKPARTPTTRRTNDLESGQSFPDKAATSGTSSPSDPPPKAPLPFYRTTKGMAIIGVGILLVLGAIIGGAVGGTKGNKKSPDQSSAPSNVTATSDQVGLPPSSQTAGVQSSISVPLPGVSSAPAAPDSSGAATSGAAAPSSSAPPAGGIPSLPPIPLPSGLSQDQSQEADILFIGP